MLAALKVKIQNFCQLTGHLKKENGKKRFHGKDEYFIQNAKLLLEESISLFDGRTNAIRCFSADELNKITDFNHVIQDLCDRFDFYHGVFEGRSVWIKMIDHNTWGNAIREIVVATQMRVHENVHKLLGCCLETEYPVLVYEGVESKSLYYRIFQDVKQDNPLPPLEWEDRLRIARQISHAVAYLHEGFSRPIIHRDLGAYNVLLGQNNVAKLSDFSLSISIPEGKTHAETENYLLGRMVFFVPEYSPGFKLSEKADVYIFGLLLLHLLTGRKRGSSSNEEEELTSWVRRSLGENKTITEIIDPTLSRNNIVLDDGDLQHQQQMQGLLELALRCRAEFENNRPTMVDVGSEIRNIMLSSQAAYPCSPQSI